MDLIGIRLSSMEHNVIPFIRKVRREVNQAVQSNQTKSIDLERLKDPFAEDDVEFKIQQCGDGNNGIWAKCLAYITARGIMDRLDSVCGPENWKVSYDFVGSDGVICNLSIFMNGEWVTKQDGAEKTDFESFKGGISSALKRAGSAWGIGRYLYSLDATFVPKENFSDSHREGAYYGKTKSGNSFYWLPPKLPAWALPIGQSIEPPKAPIKLPTHTPSSLGPSLDDRKPTEPQMKRLWAIAKANRINESDLHLVLRGMTGKNSLTELTLDRYKQFCDSILDGSYLDYLEPKNGDFASNLEPPHWVYP